MSPIPQFKSDFPRCPIEYMALPAKSRRALRTFADQMRMRFHWAAAFDSTIGATAVNLRSRTCFLRNSDGVIESSRRNARVSSSARSNPTAAAIRGMAQEVSQSS